MSRVQIPSSAPSWVGRSPRRPHLFLHLGQASSMAHSPPGFDRAAVEAALERLIAALGLDPAAEPELRETPARVRSLYEEIFAGLAPENEPELATFPRVAGASGDELV